MKILLFVILFMPLYSVEVDEDRFNNIIDMQIEDIQEMQESAWNTYAEWTYYYMLGQHAAYEDSKEIFQECIE